MMRIFNQFALSAVFAIMVLSGHASAQTITLVPRVQASQCTATGIHNNAAMNITGCAVNLPRTGEVALTFSIASESQRRTLRLEFQSRDLDPTTNHLIYFPRAPFLEGVGGTMGAQWRDLSNITRVPVAELRGQCDITPSDISPENAARLWEIAIWGDLGNSTVPSQGPALLRLRDCACRALLFKYPSSSIVRYSVANRKLTMCSDAAANIRHAENLILDDTRLVDVQLAQAGASATVDDLLYSMFTARWAQNILATRRSAGEDVSTQAQDLNTLGLRIQGIASERFPDLATQPAITLGLSRIEG